MNISYTRLCLRAILAGMYIPPPFGFLHAFGPFLYPFLGLLLVWELVIKGFALWSAARNSHRWWFVAILILNTVGILPLVYLIWFGKNPTAPAAAAPAPALVSSAAPEA